MKIVAGVSISFLLGISVGYFAGDRNSNASTSSDNQDLRGGKQSTVKSATQPEALTVRTIGNRSINSHGLKELGEFYITISESNEDQLLSELEETKQIADPELRLSRVMALYQRYGEVNPESAFQHVLTNGGISRSYISEKWLKSIFTQWAKQDLDRAIKEAVAHGLADRVGLAIISGVSRSSTEKEDILRRLGLAFHEVLLNNSIALDAVDLIKIIDDPEAVYWDSEFSGTFAGRKYAAASTWANLDPVDAMTALSDEDVRDNDYRFRRLLQTIMRGWGLRNARQALDWLETQPPSDRKTELMAAAMSGMTITAPDEALDIVMSIGNREERLASGRAVIQQWTRSDPNAVKDWYTSANPAAQKLTVGLISLTYARTDPVAAVEWVMSLPNDQRNRALPKMLGYVSRAQPELAAQLFTEISDPKAKRSAAVSILSSWTRRDLDSARDWMLQLDEDFQSKVADTFFTGAVSSGANLHEQLLIFEGKPYFDQMASRYIGQIRNTEKMKEVYSKISDQNLRKRAALGVYKILQSTDPEEAEHFRLEANIDTTKS